MRNIVSSQGWFGFPLRHIRPSYLTMLVEYDGFLFFSTTMHLFFKEIFKPFLSQNPPPCNVPPFSMSTHLIIFAHPDCLAQKMEYQTKQTFFFVRPQFPGIRQWVIKWNYWKLRSIAGRTGEANCSGHASPSQNRPALRQAVCKVKWYGIVMMKMSYFFSNNGNCGLIWTAISAQIISGLCLEQWNYLERVMKF